MYIQVYDESRIADVCQSLPYVMHDSSLARSDVCILRGTKDIEEKIVGTTPVKIIDNLGFPWRDIRLFAELIISSVGTITTINEHRS